MKNKTKTVLRTAGGEGASPYGLLLLFFAAISFLGVAVWALSSSFGGKRDRAAEASMDRSASPSVSREAKAPSYDFIEAKVEIQPFGAFCKKALARTPGDWSPMPVIDTPAMVQALYERKFAVLESAFTDCQKAYEEGRITDAQIGSAYYVFTNSDLRIDPLLTEWIGVHPKTPFSWLARARHRRSLAQYARGVKWAKDTPQINFRKMNYLLAMAQQDYVQAMDLNPRASFAYTGIMNCLRLGAGGTPIKLMFSKGITNNPGSVILWYALLEASEPKWGGSLEEMDEVMSGISRSLKNPDGLRGLRATYYQYKGDHAAGIEKDETAAELFYKRMFEHLDEFGQYRYLARRQKTWKGALLYYKKALALEPFDDESLRGAARATMNSGDAKGALLYADMAVFLDSMDPYVLRLRGEIYQNLKQWDLAMEDYRNSLVYGDDSVFAYIQLGRILDFKGRPSEAGDFLEKALSVDPESADLLFALATNQHKRKDCNLLKTTQAYLTSCKKRNAACPPKDVSWAGSVGSVLRSRGICKE
jgi:tetratricopeptide (TPR) repeat protein